MLNVIDISNWQGGMDLERMFRENPSLDGVICKATGSTWFTDEYCDRWVQWLIAHDKPWGVYHFLCDGNYYPGGKAEAEAFVKKCGNYIGQGTVWADYEFPATLRGTAYLKSFLDRLYELTGVKAGVYCSLSIVRTQGFQQIAAAGYPFWLAQYADNTTIFEGFTDHPWQQGSVAPFSRYVMQQYTSHGRLPGWDWNLDFNLFRGPWSEWQTLARGDQPEPAPLKPADPEIVAAVLRNDYGTDGDVPPRSERLRLDGYDPAAVQATVDRLYGVADKVRPLVAAELPYLDSICKIVRG